jgi:hypothetical protein
MLCMCTAGKNHAAGMTMLHAVLAGMLPCVQRSVMLVLPASWCLTGYTVHVTLVLICCG